MSPPWLLQSWRKCLHHWCCNHGANVSTVIVAIMVQMSPPLLLCWVKSLAFLLSPPRLSRGSYFKCHLQLHFTLVQQSTSTIFFGLKINIFGSSLVCVEINILYLIWSLKLKLCLLFDVEPGGRWYPSSSLRNWNYQQNRHVNRRLLLLNVFFFKWCQGILLGWYFAEIEF